MPVIEKDEADFRNKRREQSSNDNATPHVSKKTKETLESLGIFAIDHPLYSPNLSICDCFVFGRLKKELRGRTFVQSDALKEEVIGSSCGTSTSAHTSHRQSLEALEEMRRCTRRLQACNCSDYNRNSDYLTESIEGPLWRRELIEFRDPYKARVKLWTLSLVAKVD